MNFMEMEISTIQLLIYTMIFWFALFIYTVIFDTKKPRKYIIFDGRGYFNKDISSKNIKYIKI